MSADTYNQSDEEIILLEKKQFRKRIIKEITETKIPTEVNELYVLLTAMKDMDKQVMDKRKINIDSKNSEMATVVADAVSNISKVLNSSDPLSRENAGNIPITEKDRLPDYVPVPGETDIGTSTETYDVFMSKNKKSKEKPV